MRKLTARAERGAGWWVVEVPEIDRLLTQAKSLSQVPAMVKDAAALITGEPEESFEEAARAQHSAAEESRLAARELAASGLTVRDVGAVLGVSHQRAHQLVS